MALHAPNRKHRPKENQLQLVRASNNNARTAPERNTGSPRRYWASVIVEATERIPGVAPFGQRRNATPFSDQ
jgi:hypothetical protein